jgi:nicotinate-nucleotide adenylyltransferase
MARMHIALFGGSFDPPHLGHLLAACYARMVGMVDEVWVLPVARHAWAKPLSPWEQRWELCSAAFAPLPFVRLRDDETANEGGYTFDLVCRLKGSHPGYRWSLVGGSDTAADMPRWHRGAELAQLIEVIAVPRRGYDDHPAALPAISSSLVRDRCAAGSTINELVTPGVAALIRARGWYAGAGGTPPH